MRRFKRPRPYGRTRRERPAESEKWTEEKVKRLLANPFYSGVRVDPILTLERPIEEGYIQAATQIIREVGAEAFLRNFLDRLEDPSHPLPSNTTVTDDHLLSSVKVHPHFALDRPPMITDEEFIRAGLMAIKEDGPEAYLREVLENLKGNWVS